MRDELTTDRLILRPPRPDDAAAYAAGIGNPAVARRLNPIPLPYTERMASDWIARLPARPRPENATFLVEAPHAGVIGGVAIFRELGYWLAEPHWGKGYATEACRALLDWVFAHSDTERVGSAAHQDNPASANVQKKLGFTEIGRTEKYSQGRQRLVPHILTELTRTAYFRRKPQ